MLKEASAQKISDQDLLCYLRRDATQGDLVRINMALAKDPALRERLDRFRRGEIGGGEADAGASAHTEESSTPEAEAPAAAMKGEFGEAAAKEQSKYLSPAWIAMMIGAALIAGLLMFGDRRGDKTDAALRTPSKAAAPSERSGTPPIAAPTPEIAAPTQEPGRDPERDPGQDQELASAPVPAKAPAEQIEDAPPLKAATPPTSAPATPLPTADQPIAAATPSTGDATDAPKHWRLAAAEHFAASLSEDRTGGRPDTQRIARDIQALRDGLGLPLSAKQLTLRGHEIARVEALQVAGRPAGRIVWRDAKGQLLALYLQRETENDRRENAPIVEEKLADLKAARWSRGPFGFVLLGSDTGGRLRAPAIELAWRL